jgi:nicotinamidase-related amidase
LKQGHAALLVHDVVNLFLRDTDVELRRAVSNIKILVDAAREASLSIVFLAPGQGDPAVGPDPREPKIVWGSADLDVLTSLGPTSGDTVIRKPRWGGFYGSTLSEHLRSTGRDTVIVCGISLAGGVDTTVRDAYNRDFRTILVGDASRCRAIADQGWGAITSEEVERVTFSVLARFGRIVQTKEICKELADWV